jgi:uncharacterized protein UPF0150
MSSSGPVASADVSRPRWHGVCPALLGEIPECNGIYANAVALEDCREQLSGVLEERIFFRVHKNFLLPVIDGIDR